MLQFSFFMNILLLSRHIVLPLCLAIFIINLRDYFIESDHNHWWSVFFPAFKNTSSSSLNNKSPKSFLDQTSSVFCRGSNHTDRLCYFQNLCYEPIDSTFVFFLGPKSIQSGLPSDRFSPSLIDFSSVEDHNTLYFNYVEVPLSAAPMFNFSIIDGHALMFKRFHPENLMHIFHDDLIPAFATLRELSLLNIEDNKSFLVFADDSEPGPYEELYRNFLPKDPLSLTSLSKAHLTCFRNVYVGLNKLPTWYHYGFKVPQGPLPKDYNKTASVILAFRDYFLKRFKLDDASDDKKKHAILFSRKHNREIINEDEVLTTISKLTGLPARAVSLDTHAVTDIVRILSNCQLVVGMHGSLLILSLFLNPGSIVIELFPYGIHACDITPYKTLCKASGLVYRAWENTVEANTYPHPEYPAALGGLMQLSPKEQERVKNSMVTPFLCCEDPTWLYRVYQDTLVDLSSFALVLQEAYTQHRGLDANSLRTFVNSGILPSDVLNVSFVIFDASATLAWDPPWNLGFMNVSLVEYEVWIQDVEADDTKAFIVKQRRLVLPVKSLQSSLYYVWVRCYADGYVGPFGSSPFVISQGSK